MIDPVSAFLACQTAVAAVKKGIQLGKDIAGVSNDLAKFATAMSDMDFAYKQKSEPPWYAILFGGGSGPTAMDLFAKKKQMEAQRADLKQYIQFGFGQSAWNELLFIEAQVRKDRQKTMYRKAEMQQTIIEWSLGIATAIVGVGIFGTIVYFIGKNQGIDW